MRSIYADVHQDITTDLSIENVTLHSHSYYEVIYLLDGEVSYLLDTSRYRLQKGDLVFIPPNTCHQPLFSEWFKPPYDRLVIWLNPQVIENTPLKEVASALQKPMVLRNSMTNDENLALLFHHACREATDQQPGWQGIVLGIATQIFSLIYRISVNEPTVIHVSNEKKILLDDVAAYIDTHMQDKISLSSVAQEFLVSESTISKAFHSQMRLGFYSYVIRRRLIAAKDLISDGVSLQEIPTRVGYADYSSFYRAFKQEFGVSPSQYREVLSHQ